MYQSNSFNGSGLPPKTLCFTFDDGPGIHTLEIASFLFEHHIRATFFVVGKYAFHHPEILLQLKQMNHLIGNHTFDHPDLPYYVSVDGNVLDQVLRTDTIIKPYIDSQHVYFRPPYGKWSAEVARELNQSIFTTNHIGPVYWDIAGVDCYYWQNNWPVADAAARYVIDIERHGHGIVVMHDDTADMDIVKPKNQTLDLVKILVPQLLDLGYQFVRLDEITSIKTVSPEKQTFTLHCKNGRYINLKNQFELDADGKPGNPNNLLQLEELGHGKIAIKAANNLYLSANNNTGEVIANQAEIGTTETFDLIPVHSTKLMLRCTNGNFLGIAKNGKLDSKSQYMRQAAIFRFANHNTTVKTTISLKQRYVQLKKQVLFIKSKLQQKV